jgi:methyl-accepting chemotaxis protein
VSGAPAPAGPPADTGPPPPGEGAGGWTIRRKLQWSFGTMILLIVVLGGVSISSISRLRDISAVLSDQDLLLTRTASNVQFGLTLARVNRLLYTERGDTEAYQAALDKMKETQAEIARATELTQDFQVREMLSRIAQGIGNWMGQAEDLKRLVEEQRNAYRRQLLEAAQKVETDLDDLGPGPAAPAVARAAFAQDAPAAASGPDRRLVDLHDLLIRAMINLRAYTIRPEMRFGSEAEKNLAEALQRLDSLRTQGGPYQATLADLRKEATQMRTEFAALRDVERTIQDLDVALSGEASAQMASAGTLHDHTTRSAQADSARSKALATTSMWTIIGLTVVIIILGTAVATLLPMAIGRNLAEVVRVAHRVGQGDLTLDSNVRSRDELGQLARSLNGMRANLHRIVERIQRTSLSLVTATNQILASSEEQSRTSTAQSSSVTEISATINELNATASELNRNMHVVAERANDCAGVSQRADQAVREALDGMQRITATNATAAQRFTALAEKIEAIETVLASVSQIAERTELLSLNASIEAAKAGEQGKGFAVVAGEIRRLADRTGEASQQVGRLVAEVRAATDASVMSMEQSSQEIRNGAALMGGVGQNMHSIDQAVREILQQMDGIRIASEQLATATGQVSIAVASIQDGATQVSTGARQAASGAYSLNSTAGELRETVSEFRLIRR